MKFYPVLKIVNEIYPVLKIANEILFCFKNSQ